MLIRRSQVHVNLFITFLRLMQQSDSCNLINLELSAHRTLTQKLYHKSERKSILTIRGATRAADVTNILNQEILRTCPVLKGGSERKNQC